MGIAALTILLAIHIVGFILVGLLLLPIFRAEENDPEDEDNTDDGWGNNTQHQPPKPSSPSGGLPLPLPDAQQSKQRFRTAGRLADRFSVTRRPQHAPMPLPHREPVS
jgi:hypothetical protein